MYYHIIIERNEKVGKNGSYKTLYEFDSQDLDKIKAELVIPYKNNEEIVFKGYPLGKKDIRRFAIKCSEKTVEEIRQIQKSKISPDVLFILTRSMVVEDDQLVKDITIDVLKSVDTVNFESVNVTKAINMNKIFIVHGHDDSMKHDVARFIERLGFEAVILHEQVNEGLTVIEKFEKFSDTGYGVVLYSPCDVGSKNEKDATLKPRARQNVIFEHGYLIGKLGRHKVAALYKDKVELPSDIDGVLYIPYKNGDWKIKIAKELKNVGYSVDMNSVI